MTAPEEDRPGYEHAGAGDTEHAGAENVRRTGKRVRAELLRIFREHPSGLTDEEATEICTFEGVTRSRTSVGARRFDLVGDGLVRDSGIRRKSSFGVPNTVWVVVPPEERTQYCQHKELGPTYKTPDELEWRKDCARCGGNVKRMSVDEARRLQYGKQEPLIDPEADDEDDEDDDEDDDEEEGN